MDLRERLDRELSEPPRPAPDLIETLVAGRRAVRRRRAVAGVAGLATAVVVGGMGWLLVPNDESTQVAPEPPSQEIPVDGDSSNDCHRVPAAELDACRGPSIGDSKSDRSIYYVPGEGPVRRDPGVRVLEAVDNPIGIDTFNAAYTVDDNGMRLLVLVGPQLSASEAADRRDLETWLEQLTDDLEVTGRDGAPDDPPAHYNSKGVLVVDEGAEIVEEIPNPLGVDGGSKSVGLAVEHGGRTTWLLLTWEQGTDSIDFIAAQQGFATLQEWIDDHVAMQQGRATEALVEFDADGTLRPLDGVQIVEQRRGVDLGSFPPASTVVARLLVDGDPWFVAACECGGDPAFLLYNTPAAGETLDDFIAYYHRARNASGEGVR